MTWETVETVTRTDLGRFPRFTHALRHHDGRLASLMCGGVTKRWRVVEGEPTCQKCAAWKKKGARVTGERERMIAPVDYVPLNLERSVFEQRNCQNAAGMVKTLPDLERYRLILERTRPTHIIETGTLSGRSAYWFACFRGAEVLTIDTDPRPFDMGILSTPAGAHITRIVSSSTDLGTVALARHWSAGGRRVMVVLDSDHSASHVLAELRHYGPLVSPGCYLVVEDGIIRWCPEQWPNHRGSPLDAVEVWRGTDDIGRRFVRDVELEGLSPTTQHVGGWLLRSLDSIDAPEGAPM